MRGREMLGQDDASAELANPAGMGRCLSLGRCFETALPGLVSMRIVERPTTGNVFASAQVSVSRHA